MLAVILKQSSRENEALRKMIRIFIFSVFPRLIASQSCQGKSPRVILDAQEKNNSLYQWKLWERDSQSVIWGYPQGSLRSLIYQVKTIFIVIVGLYLPFLLLFSHECAMAFGKFVFANKHLCTFCTQRNRCMKISYVRNIR